MAPKTVGAFLVLLFLSGCPPPPPPPFTDYERCILDESKKDGAHPIVVKKAAALKKRAAADASMIGDESTGGIVDPADVGASIDMADWDAEQTAMVFMQIVPCQ